MQLQPWSLTLLADLGPLPCEMVLAWRLDRMTDDRSKRRSALFKATAVLLLLVCLASATFFSARQNVKSIAQSQKTDLIALVRNATNQAFSTTSATFPEGTSSAKQSDTMEVEESSVPKSVEHPEKASDGSSNSQQPGSTSLEESSEPKSVENPEEEESNGSSKEVQASSTGVEASSVPKTVESTNHTTPQRVVWILADVKKGRLGNHIFYYASVYGIYRRWKDREKEGNTTLNFQLGAMNWGHATKPYREFRNIFMGPLAEPVPKEPLYTKAMYFHQPVHHTAFYDYNMSLCQDEACAFSFSGFLCSYKYFESVEDEIRSLFRFKWKYRGLVAQEYQDMFVKAKEDGVAMVGIHVRRADMLEDPGRNVPPISYFHRAMERMRERHGSVYFLVASQNQAWCHEAFGNMTNVTIIKPTSEPVVDILILSQCQHGIVSVGSFGWWAAYLTGGDVIYFKDEFDYKHPKFSPMNPDDYYPTHWTGLT